MTREEAIICLKGIKNYGRDTFTEQTNWQDCLDMAIKALEQEPCEDCISRADAMTKIQMNASRYQIARERGGMGLVEWSDNLIAIKDALDIIRDLPSVTPREPKTGHWNLLDECANSGYYCSNCHKKLVKEGWSNTVKKIKYSPNCGCRLESEVFGDER